MSLFHSFPRRALGSKRPERAGGQMLTPSYPDRVRVKMDDLRPFVIITVYILIFRLGCGAPDYSQSCLPPYCIWQLYVTI